MASKKGVKVMKVAKKVAESGSKSTFLKATIPAGMATPAPPLGPQLGARNINIAQFCKDFNLRTSKMKEGTPLPCRVSVNADRTYNLVIHHPPVTYFLKQAAGIKKGATRPGQEVAGKVTLKHIYEIARLKSEDPTFEGIPLKKVCERILGVAHSMGIQIVETVQFKEYQRFLNQRKTIIEEEEKELEAIKQAKLLRV
ncbi:39S ribosomal protein L11, mitochondrial [Lingula anatina]|uniref:Large ribosomal subunit protein uL11m n=1 Tax=Lingula anatina TaxID=7574 RepID=A0A1S3I4K3_LINAN|nr:39S ribosomal protein L11, mitochondrial [Lingula anatina]|eukprot:XP_013392766.1 39S ribosomal protein L11, mitochondrial [Lingula anatina]